MPKPSQKQSMSYLLANHTSKKSWLKEDGNDTGKAVLLIVFIERTEAEWSQLNWTEVRKTESQICEISLCYQHHRIFLPLFSYMIKPIHIFIACTYAIFYAYKMHVMHIYMHTLLCFTCKIGILSICIQHLLIENIFYIAYI